MRWILWDGDQEMPDTVFDELARIIVRVLGAGGSDTGGSDGGGSDAGELAR